MINGGISGRVAFANGKQLGVGMGLRLLGTLLSSSPQMDWIALCWPDLGISAVSR